MMKRKFFCRSLILLFTLISSTIFAESTQVQEVAWYNEDFLSQNAVLLSNCAPWVISASVTNATWVLGEEGAGVNVYSNSVLSVEFHLPPDSVSMGVSVVADVISNAVAEVVFYDARTNVSQFAVSEVSGIVTNEFEFNTQGSDPYAFIDFFADDGRVETVYSTTFILTLSGAAEGSATNNATDPPATCSPGLLAAFFGFPADMMLAAMPDVATVSADYARVDPQVVFPYDSEVWTELRGRFPADYASRHSGFLEIPAGGTYRLHLKSDDGSVMYIDGIKVIDNDGLHAVREKSCSLYLEEGMHEIVIDYFEAGGGATLILEWTPPGAARSAVPASALWHFAEGGNANPFVKVKTPYADNRFPYGQTIPVTATAWDMDGVISRLDLHAGFERVFSTTNSGELYFELTNAPVGSADLTAVAFDELGACSTSMPFRVETLSQFVGYGNGLNEEFYQFATNIVVIPAMDGIEPDVSRVSDMINYTPSDAAWEGLPSSMSDRFASRHHGCIFAEDSGLYSFHLTSDDGAVLWVDGKLVVDRNGLHAAGETSAEIFLKRGMHEFRVDYFDNQSLSCLVLRWTPPGGEKAVLPMHLFFIQTGNPDSDGDGMPDWWETMFGFSPDDQADAGHDPDGDALSNLDEFLAGSNPLVPDSDLDGIPDGGEVSMGLNPSLSDIGLDSDGDGLSNFMEYNAGSNPLSVDSDSDGIDDFSEVMLLHSNPAAQDFDGTVTILKTIHSADADLGLGRWMMSQDGLSLLGRSGAVAYTDDFVSTTPGIYLVEVDYAGVNLANSRMRCVVDGTAVGVRALNDAASDASTVRFFTQWLDAGAHDIVLEFEDIQNSVSLSIGEVRIGIPGGGDSDGDGMADWLASRLAFSSVSASSEVLSRVSPYCLRGRSAFPSLVALQPQAETKPLPGNGWWANVELSQDAPVEVAVSIENGFSTRAVNISWVPFNVMTSGDIVIRRGDSLLLEADVDGGGGGMAIVGIGGYTNVAISAGERVPFRFDVAGQIKVSSVFTNSAGAATNRLYAQVVQAPLDGSLPAWTGRLNTYAFPHLSLSNAVLAGDSDLAIETEPLQPQGVNALIYVPESTEPRAVAVFIDNPDAAVADSAEVLGFSPRYTIEGVYSLSGGLEDGTQVVQNRRSAKGLPSGASIRLSVGMPGVCFEDGSSVLSITSEDLDVFGEFSYRMYLAPGVTNPCHFIKVYRGSELLVY